MNGHKSFSKLSHRHIPDTKMPTQFVSAPVLLSVKFRIQIWRMPITDEQPPISSLQLERLKIFAIRLPDLPKRALECTIFFSFFQLMRFARAGLRCAFYYRRLHSFCNKKFIKLEPHIFIRHVCIYQKTIFCMN